MANIVVAGTLYVDLVLSFAHLPKPGETVVASRADRWVGGKGANQAAMSCKLGVRTRLVGSVGQDGDGEFLLSALERLGVDCSLVARHPSLGTGLSVIAVDPVANNMILSYGGANTEYPDALRSEAVAAVRTSDAVLLHAEVPREMAGQLLATAREAGKPVYLTPAPPERVPTLPLHEACVLFPNQTEAEGLTGVAADDPVSARRAGHLLLERFGAGLAVITLGDQGALITGRRPGSEGLFQVAVPPFPVEALDTTAAGDAFCAAFASYLAGRGSGGFSDPALLSEAGRFAAVAGALTASRAGAVSALPSLDEITAITENLPPLPRL